MPDHQLITAGRHLGQGKGALGVGLRQVGMIGDEKVCQHPETSRAAGDLHHTRPIEPTLLHLIGIREWNAQECRPAQGQRMIILIPRNDLDRLATLDEANLRTFVPLQHGDLPLPYLQTDCRMIPWPSLRRINTTQKNHRMSKSLVGTRFVVGADCGGVGAAPRHHCLRAERVGPGLALPWAWERPRELGP